VKGNYWRTIAKITLNYVVPLGLGVAILWYLVGIYQSEPADFWSRASLIIASTAAIFAGISALIANRSLELTRAAQRPFVNVSPEVEGYTGWSSSKEKNTVRFEHIIARISNKGAFPADKVSIRCEVSKTEKNARSFLLVPQKEIASIYFPDEETRHIFEKGPNAEELTTMNRGDELRVRITVNYVNKLTQKKHNTIRVYSMKCDPSAQDVIPLPKEDYWD